MISAEAYTSFPTVEADERVSYGRNENQFIDLFLPKQTAVSQTAVSPPTLFLIHGGCWRAQYGLEPMGQFARALADRGTAVCNIEYRRLGNGGGWPNTFLDVATAFDALPQIAKTHNLDLNRLVISGHSAGGHLALWLASRPRMINGMIGYTESQLPICGVVSLAGIPNMADAVTRNICGDAPIELLAGSPTSHPDHYAQGSPDRFLPFGVPHIHINGTDDWIVPHDYVEAFVARARSAGDSAELISIPGVGHFEIVMSTHAAWESVATAIHRLMAVDR